MRAQSWDLLGAQLWGLAPEGPQGGRGGVSGVKTRPSGWRASAVWLQSLHKNPKPHNPSESRFCGPSPCEGLLTAATLSPSCRTPRDDRSAFREHGGVGRGSRGATGVWDGLAATGLHLC